jgi:hypothetical protein
MRILNYTVIEPFMYQTESNPPINQFNLLIASGSLDDLEFWEKHLDRKGLDYCIIQAVDNNTDTDNREYYGLITDMASYNDMGRIICRRTSEVEAFQGEE